MPAQSKQSVSPLTKQILVLCGLTALAGYLLYRYEAKNPFNALLNPPAIPADYTQAPLDPALQSKLDLLVIDRKKAEEQLSTVPLKGKDKAYSQYILAQLKQREGATAEAKKIYKNIEIWQIPFLAERVLLHLAEIAALESKEKEVIGLTEELLRRYPDSISAPFARYELGRSYLRQNQKEKAREIFFELSKNKEKSRANIEAHYYLGVLSEAAERDALWYIYLEALPAGQFTPEIEKSWLQSEGALSPKHKTALGKILYFQNQKDPKAAALLQAEENEISWFLLAQLKAKDKKNQEAIGLLQRGLTKYFDDPDYYSALSLLYKLLPKEQYASTAQFFLSVPTNPHNARILWLAADRSKGEQKKQLYKLTRSLFPQSKYAARALGELFWETYASGKQTEANAYAQDLIQNFPKSPERARALFWLAKAQLKAGSDKQALTGFSKVLTEHPDTFYAYRAQNLLQKDQKNWPNPPLAKQLPTESQSKIPTSELKQLSPALQELYRLNLWQEFLGAMPLDYSKNFPGVQAWARASVDGDFAGSIKAASDAIGNENLALGQAKELWKLSYPLHYAEAVFVQAKRNKLSPYLLLALIRQESRFNAKAISSSDALGLCQLLPGTAQGVTKALGYTGFKRDKLFQSDYNLACGGRYLGDMIADFGGRPYLAVAAYNAGPGAVKKWLSEKGDADPDLFVENIPYPETRQYVKNVFENYWVYEQLYAN